MKWQLLCLSAALLAGCQTPPPYVTRPVDPVPMSPMERGIGSKHELNREPHRAAVCIARNIDAQRPGLKARIVPGRDAVIAEVEVSAAKLIALVQLLIRGDASIAAVWTTPELAQPREELVSVMLQGC